MPDTFNLAIFSNANLILSDTRHFFLPYLNITDVLRADDEDDDKERQLFIYVFLWCQGCYFYKKVYEDVELEAGVIIQ